jgi:RelA/SpoT family (p)ppGpp synthetase
MTTAVTHPPVSKSARPRSRTVRTASPARELKSLRDLTAVAATYLPAEQVQALDKVYAFAAEAHTGQSRLSGDPYIQHPLAVAMVLAEMHMDYETLAAAMLHDVIEDTKIDKAQLEAEFGEDVAKLVDGVSKLTQMKFESQAEAQAQNFRKMMMAMAHDIRVILVKLADRVHNMRTIEHHQSGKRRSIARETLEIYAPIAQRLGMNTVRLELEDLGFAALYPMRCRVFKAQVRKARGNRKEIVNQIKNAIKRRLRQEHIAGQVIGREKHVYSIYRKMRVKQLSFSEVFDKYAFRVLVDSVDTCYRVLGVVHNLYKPLPGQLEDYVAIPKPNGYQSLHTGLFGPYGVPIEVQIRTHEMDEIAEHGIAAHWLYKTGDASANGPHQRAREWLRSVLEMQRHAGNPEEFLENVKIDLFPDTVYVFTPKGDIMQLPRGATAVDLAYAIHTDVGNTCVAARVNRRLAPLSARLMTGQTVEIITAPGARPNPVWLNFAVSGKARSSIHDYLKNLQRDEARALGQRMLDRELGVLSLSLETVEPERLQACLEEFKLKHVDDLLVEIGLGKRMAPLVARYLGTAPGASPKLSGAVPGAPAEPLLIKGTEGMVVSFPKCCSPIPGDPVMGYVTAGRGIVVHRRSCKNLAEFRNQPEKWIELEWQPQTQGEFAATIRLLITNQRGVLATIAATIADQSANIENLAIADRDDRYVTMTFTILVRDRTHLARVIQAVRKLKHIARVARAK